MKEVKKKKWMVKNKVQLEKDIEKLKEEKENIIIKMQQEVENDKKNEKDEKKY